MTGLTDRQVGEALDALASRAQPAAAGVASALACAAAAALVELTAGLAADRLAAESAGGPGGEASHLRALAGEAGQLRRRLLAAADEDADAYGRVLAARDPAARARALDQASEPPLAIAEVAAEVAEAAAETARAGTWAFRADAVVAAALAATAAGAGAELVGTNLAAAQGDPRLDRARAAAARAALWLTKCEGARPPTMVAAPDAVDLTAREREIALLAAAGASSREIADRLVISVRTVDNHLQNAYRKLGVTRRQDLHGVLSATSEEP